VAKYVNKKSDMDLAAKGLGAKEWNNSLKTKLSLLPKKLFRIRMSRNFGMKMLTMTNLSTECLIQLTKLGYDATPFNQIDRKSGSAGMPRPSSYAVFCLKKKKNVNHLENPYRGPAHKLAVILVVDESGRAR